jgi:hypothetical protein
MLNSTVIPVAAETPVPGVLKKIKPGVRRVSSSLFRPVFALVCTIGLATAVIAFLTSPVVNLFSGSPGGQIGGGSWYVDGSGQLNWAPDGSTGVGTQFIPGVSDLGQILLGAVQDDYGRDPSQ